MIDVVVGYNCPGDARHLVCQCHSDQPERPTLQKGRDPQTGRAFPFWGAEHHRLDADNEASPYLPVAGFGNLAKSSFTRGGILPRYQIQPGGKVASPFEHTKVRDFRHD